MRNWVAVVLLSLSIACSSASSRPADVAAPDLDVAFAAPLFFGSSRTAPASFNVTVTNQAKVPMTVHSLRLSSPSMAQYGIRPVQRLFNETLAPGESKTLYLSTTAIAAVAGIMAMEPLTLRVEGDFAVAGQRYHELFNVVNVQ